MELTPQVRQQILEFQRTEITDYHIYKRPAGWIRILLHNWVLHPRVAWNTSAGTL
jgi:hypothetical protein